MAIPTEQALLVDSMGQRLDIDELVEKLREEGSRVLADDEVGIVLYTGDLDIFQLQPTDHGDYLAKPVTEIRRPRFSTRVLRRQIGAAVVSVTADAVFVAKDGERLRKVRAEDLEVGMVLESEEKVFR